MSFLLAAAPAKAEPALDECWSGSESRVELGECLRDLKTAVDADLEGALGRADKSQKDLDAIADLKRSTRALERAQLAFELYRNLECRLRELQAGSGTGAGDFFLGCWVDMTRQRIAALRTIVPDPPANKLAGTTWLAEDIEGRGVSDLVQSTLTFESIGKVIGTGGCNNFFASVKIDADTIRFGPAGATRMACGEAADEQEHRFFAALERVRNFDFDRELLLLLDSDGQQMLRLNQKP